MRAVNYLWKETFVASAVSLSLSLSLSPSPSLSLSLSQCCPGLELCGEVLDSNGKYEIKELYSPPPSQNALKFLKDWQWEGERVRKEIALLENSTDDTIA